MTNTKLKDLLLECDIEHTTESTVVARPKIQDKPTPNFATIPTQDILIV
jgi:hypothetical protein